MFSISWFLRNGDGSMTYLTLGCEVLGAALLGYAGLLGGELVVRNMISVNHRYADAGKWNEEAFTVAPGQSLTVAAGDELKNGHMKLLWVNGRRIALARTAEAIARSKTAVHIVAGRWPAACSSVTPCTVSGTARSSTSRPVRSKAVLRSRRFGVYETRVRSGHVILVAPEAQD